jgi:hypothetical protein
MLLEISVLRVLIVVSCIEGDPRSMGEDRVQET